LESGKGKKKSYTIQGRRCRLRHRNCAGVTLFYLEFFGFGAFLNTVSAIGYKLEK